jgi:nucleoside-diphosphate kinase
MCKPDAVERNLVGQILARLEAKGLRMAAGELRVLDEATARQHYAEHDGKPFFPSLLAFVTRGPSFLMVLEGPDEAFAIVRQMMGATNPRLAAPGTIRGDLAPGYETTENLIHGSDSEDSASREISIFFPAL